MATIIHTCSILFLCFWSILNLVRGKVVSGELDTKENWAFITRFCFLSRYGQFIFNISFPKSYLVQNLLLYYDADTQWPAVYKSNKTCHEKEAVLSKSEGQVIPLNPFTHMENNLAFQWAGEENVSYAHFYGIRKFISSRERWWFIAASNCHTQKGLKMKYFIQMTNDESSFWYRHFSADKFYILHTDIVMSVAYLILLIATIAEGHVLKQRHLLHKTYKLFIASVLLEFCGLLFLCVYYGLYSRSGVGDHLIKLIGKCLESCSTALFLLLLILIAKGYTVTRGRLRGITCAKIGVFMTCYVIIYAALFIYQQKYFDPGEVLYIYESPAGYGIIGLRLIAWAWFIYACVFTLIHYPNKSDFYTRLFVFYTVWLLALPVIILIATYALGKWMRERTVNCVEIVISLEAHIIFFILTRPSAANKNFPFHVRTTQIDIMETSRNGIIGNNSLDGFCLHPYAPSHITDQPPDYASLFGAQRNSMEMNNRTEQILPTAPYHGDENPSTQFQDSGNVIESEASIKSKEYSPTEAKSGTK